MTDVSSGPGRDTLPHALVRTRFAPSPTGYLHIGGVRTALFNWLFTRRHGGSFILRIDDTDARRNVEQALAPILAGFRWLGLDWDEGPEVGGDLLASGHAYLDYATSEEIQDERQAAEQAGERFIYSRRWRAESEADQTRFEAEGRSAIVRLAMPREGSCRFTDLVRGDVEFDWAREQDHVIRRADGSVLYHLASAVDDIEMGVTHVIRAEEHLSNTPRHLFMTTGLGAEAPVYAHLPYVAEPGSKTKLSKRKLAKYLNQPDFARLAEHGRKIAEAIGHDTDDDAFNPVIVDFYETIGYLPEALLNYLLLLGWSLDDKTEHLDREQMIHHFSLERVQSSPAGFDPAKLASFQERYMRELSPERRLELCLPFLQASGLVGPDPDEGTRHKVATILAAAGDRITAAGDVVDYADFFTADSALPFDEKAFEKRLRKPAEAADLLQGFGDRLAAAEAFDAVSLEALLRTYVEERGVKLGQVIHALRVAVTGKPVGFGMFEILEILGRESCLARIDRALAAI
jgi:glutamyl-tRNA synthetase